MDILLLGALLLAVAVALVYNRLVRDRNRVDSAWSDIDVQLQRRHDLIPQLVSAVKHYAEYERTTLEAVVSLRAAAADLNNVADRGRAEEQLSGGVTRLIALAEQYPDLKADENFLKLQADLVEAENYLQFARRFYNGSVRQYNTRVETVPNNFVAGRFKFELRDFFQKASDDIAAVPLVNLGRVE
jgi:LemA protein